MFLKGIVTSSFCLIVLVYTLETNDTTLQTFHHFSTNHTLNLKVIKDQSIYIKCPVSCTNCTKVNVKWEYNGYHIKPGEYFEINEHSIYIKHYDSTKHSGYYTCTVSSTTLSLRSPQIRVDTVDFPEFVIKTQSSYVNGTVMFTCYNSSKLYSSDFQVTWYKDNVTLSNNDYVDIWDELLLIKKISFSDVGKYHCEIRKVGSLQLSRKSQQRLLRIQKVSTIKSPTIYYVTANKEVFYNSTFVLFCSTKGLYNADISIYKRSSDGLQEFKLKQNINSIIITQQAIESTIYICEAEDGNVRAKEEISIKVISVPKISQNGLIHSSQYIGRDISFDCKSVGNPVPSVSWYHNGKKISNIVSDDGIWLNLKGVTEDDAGMYQCIAENTVGAYFKYTYLSLGISGLTPLNLQVETISSTTLTATWDKPSELDIKKDHFYRLFWTSPSGTTNTNDTISKHILITQGLYGGLKYALKVCLVFVSNKDIEDCAFYSVVMPESAPTKGPLLKQPIQTRAQFFDVTWNLIPSEYAMGKIQNYTIYCELMYGKTEIFIQLEPTKTNSAINLSLKGNYKIWMTAFTSAGESPKSNAFVIQSDLVEPYNNMAELEVKWRNERLTDKHDTATLSWKSVNTSHRYILYYVRIPYKNYWREVNSTDIPNTSTTFLVHNLDSHARYRFTLIPVKTVLESNNERMKSKGSLSMEVEFLGRTSNAYLVPISEMQQNNGKVIPAPESLECLKIEFEDHLMLRWKQINSSYKDVVGYRITIFSDVDGITQFYSTRETHIYIKNLTKGFWYGVQVQGYGELEDDVYLKSHFKSCRTKTKAPSIVRDVKYHFVFNLKERVAFLHLSWRAPVYTGGSTYSYKIVRVAKNKDILPFPFPPDSHHFIMKRQENSDRIHLGAIWTESIGKKELSHKIEISAVNDVGVGKPYINNTHGIYYPIGKIKEIVVPEKPWTPKDVRMGIVIGVSISIFFLLILIVVCAVKEPCKKASQHTILGNEVSDEYLYVQKLKQTKPTSSDSSQDSNESRVSRKTKIKRWKFFQLVQPFYRNYQQTNASELSNTCVLYSSGISSSGSRVHNCSRSRCQSQCVGSCSGLHSSSDRTSEGQITFLSETAST